MSPKPLMSTQPAAAHSGLRVVSADEKSPYPKASLILRGMARLVDVAIAWGFYLLAGRAGFVVAVLYILLADGLSQGQSLGKKIFGVKALYLPSRTAARFRESVLRNAPFGLIVLLGMMPRPLGWVAFWSGAVVIAGIEAWKVFRDPLGIRLGDIWAQTQVIDGKVVAGAPEVADAGDPAREPGSTMSISGQPSNRRNRVAHRPHL